jgi:hypothetical protein
MAPEWKDGATINAILRDPNSNQYKLFILLPTLMWAFV